MLSEVESPDFLRGGHAKANRGAQSRENYRDDRGDVGSDGRDPYDLHDEEIRVSRVEEAVLCREKAGQYRAERAAAAMHRDRADGVINHELLVYELHRVHDDDAGDYAYDERAGRADEVTSRRYGDESCERAVERHRDIGLAVANPCHRHCRHGGGGSRHVSGDED